MSWNYFRLLKGAKRKFGGVLIPQNIGGDPKEVKMMTNMLKEKLPIVGKRVS